eukprot:4684806-Amphidinium_carterae.2
MQCVAEVAFGYVAQAQRRSCPLRRNQRIYTATKPGGVAKPKTDTRPDDPMDVGGSTTEAARATRKGKDGKDKGASKGKGATPKTDIARTHTHTVKGTLQRTAGAKHKEES